VGRTSPGHAPRPPVGSSDDDVISPSNSPTSTHSLPFFFFFFFFFFFLDRLKLFKMCCVKKIKCIKKKLLQKLHSACRGLHKKEWKRSVLRFSVVTCLSLPGPALRGSFIKARSTLLWSSPKIASAPAAHIQRGHDARATSVTQREPFFGFKFRVEKEIITFALKMRKVMFWSPYIYLFVCVLLA